jgi:predicted MFS family arabinose efflux permease
VSASTSSSDKLHDDMATLWRHRDFRLLLSGETISELGSQISIVAVSLVAVRSLHATSFQVGVLVASSTAAFLLIGLPAGAWVDRLRRRPVMIATDLGRLVAMGSIPVAYEFGALTMSQMYVVMFLAGILTVFFDVAYQSYLPSLVGGDALVEANSKLSISAQIAGVAGPSLAGVLVQVIGGPLAVAVDAASYGASALAVSAIRIEESQPRPRSHPNLRSEIGEGLHFVFRHPILRAIAITTASSNLFSSTIAAVEIVFLVRVIHLQPGVIGVVFAAAGIGGVAGGFTASTLARRIGSARATLVGIALTAPVLLLPLSTRSNGALFFAIGWFSMGLGSVIYNVNQVSFRQRLCPPELLGRMNASMRFVVSGVMPIGALFGGAIGSTLGLRAALWVGAVGVTLPIIWLAASPVGRVRDFPEQ